MPADTTLPENLQPPRLQIRKRLSPRVVINEYYSSQVIYVQGLALAFISGLV